jgi:hypothetical protein
MPTCFYLFSAETYFWHYGAWVPYSGSETLFLPFWPTKVYFFLLHVKFPIDGYITRPYWFWALRLICALWTPKSTYFHTPFKILDRWIYHTTILILCNKFRFWALGAYFSVLDISHDHIDFGPQIPFLGSGGLFSPFWPPKVYFFLLHVKFPIDWYITRPYLFWSPNSVFGLWRPIFFIYTKFPIDWWVTWPISFLSLSVPSLGIRRTPNFFGLRTLSIKLQSILPF